MRDADAAEVHVLNSHLHRPPFKAARRRIWRRFEQDMLIYRNAFCDQIKYTSQSMLLFGSITSSIYLYAGSYVIPNR